MKLINLVFFFVFIAVATSPCVAQSDAWPTVEGARREDDRPKSIKETLEKMRVEKEKRDYKEMLARGEEAVKLAEELEEAVIERRSFTRDEVEKIQAVEKLVKRIRSDLGGGKIDENSLYEEVSAPTDLLEGVRYLKQTTVSLLQELKKTTRFSISAAAIQSSNAILYFARFLRLSK